ncbi:uncharacterized protein [Aristolochia californica]|uniref:uncharacterized protein n=1 Tax=Aristolochia californica TaxID=171875 RepID=UPI0035D6B6B7
MGEEAGRGRDGPSSLLAHYILSSTNFLSRLKATNQGPKPSTSCCSCKGASALFADSPMALSSPQSSNYASNSTSSLSTAGFPSSVRFDGLNSSSTSKSGGPAFVGQVFTMCDPSGTGLMAVTNHLQIPFLTQRIPKWVKEVFTKLTQHQKDGPVFRFFMDLSDAVAYVKRLNIPTGMVGACRLDVAYDHFKEKPHMFQFVPNRKQVKAANKLLRTISRSTRGKRVIGVPVFTAQNLNIAIATTDGIKWYTPYFFDKDLLDNILDASIDQHFQTLIQSRHMQRRRDMIDDSLAADVIEENGDSLFEPPEVQEVLDEMGQPGIPFSVISKAAQVQLLDAVDRVLLGNRWLRKATRIQPIFPYVVDSFEERITSLTGGYAQECPPNPLLPKITMIGISTSEAGPRSRVSLKKIMEDLSREMEHTSQQISQVNQDMDPLFVANVGDYTTLTKSTTP